MLNNQCFGICRDGSRCLNSATHEHFCSKHIYQKRFKYCIYCGKKIIRKEWEKTVMSPIAHSWFVLKYCDNVCQQKASRKRKKHEILSFL